jgi:hypothetical protein
MSAQTATAAEAPVPDWMLGIWRRQWIERAGVKSSTTEVEYLQTPRVFGDVRFPTDRPQFTHAASFADLTDDDLKALAQQYAMAGRTRVAGAVATWDHEIRYQPPNGETDAGRLDRSDGAVIYEHGLDGSYTEAWEVSRATRFLVVRIERSGRLDRLLILAGNRFMFIRNRAKDLPTSDSLDALITSTKLTRDQIIEYLDCEFSIGSVPGGHASWMIQKSTLPWLESHRLEFVDRLGAADFSSGLARHDVGDEHWSVPVNTLSRGEIQALFR